jgi:hypothetical protein
VQQIAQETGNDFEDVKLYLKRRAMSMGYPMLMDEKGEVTCSLVDGEPLPQHEREATSEEAALLIDAAHMLAAELEIVLTEEG